MKYKVNRTIVSTEEFWVESESRCTLRESLRQDFDQGLLSGLLINKETAYYILADGDKVVEEFRMHWDNVEAV